MTDDIRCTWDGCGLPVVCNEGGDKWLHSCAFEDIGRWWPGSSTISLVANKGAKVEGMATSTHPATPDPEVAEAKLAEARERWGEADRRAAERLAKAMTADE